MSVIVLSAAKPAAAATPGLSLFGGLQPVANRASYLQDATSNGAVTATFQYVVTAFGAVNEVVLVFGNYGGNQAAPAVETDGQAAITFTASIVLTDGVTIFPVTFKGAPQASGYTIQPGETVKSDPVTINLAGGKFHVRVFANNPGSSHNYPNGFSVDQQYDTNGGYDASGTDKTMGGTIATGITNVAGFGPCLILGTTPTPSSKLVALIGDSICAGVGDKPLNYGYLARTMTAAGLPYVNVGLQAERSYDFLAKAHQKRRGQLYAGCTHAVCEYGVNDIHVDHATLATVQANLILLWSYLSVNRGMRTWQTTITPETTSTDGWTTTVNQSAVNAGDSTTAQNLNTWLRAGAPMVAGAAVAVGTGGALVAGVAGHPLQGIFDIAGQVESTLGSQVWRVDQGVSTLDGVHPSQAMHTYVAANAGIVLT